MKSRPILFSGPMVRAILEGRKTQTRRLVKPQPAIATPGCFDESKCPYGQPGDQLWVKESGWKKPDLTVRQLREGADTWPPYEYDVEPLCCWADGELKQFGWKHRPSRYMPRWASRITLEITGVRVERLQGISIQDALDEGCPGEKNDRIAALPQFRALWESIHGPGSWDANSWVWVIGFKRV